MSARSGSPLIDRIAAKLGCSKWEAKRLKRAFVEALKEEVEARYDAWSDTPNDPQWRVPLVIAGLGSFRMVERPTRTFADPAGPKDAVVVKAPAAYGAEFSRAWQELCKDPDASLAQQQWAAQWTAGVRARQAVEAFRKMLEDVR